MVPPCPGRGATTINRRMASVTSVCAVVRAGADAAATVAALDAQTRPPDARRVLAAPAASVGEAIGAARDLDAEWLWLLEPDVQPAPTALAELLASLGRFGGEELPEPVLLTSKVLGPHGHLDPRSAPWLPLLGTERIVQACRRRVVAVRLARWGSLLVRRDLVSVHGAPRADYAGGADDLEWTARVLRDGAGYLVPRSVAVRSGTAVAGPPAAEVRDRARMLRGSGWVAHEPVWFGFLLAVDVARAAAERPRSVPRLLRAVASGVRARP